MRRFIGIVCIAAALGCAPPAAESTAPPKPAGSPAPTSGTTSHSALPGKATTLVSMKVDMHCPFGCYPRAKEVLESLPGVASVELAKQKKEDEIDNPVVYVKLNGDFDAKAAIAALGKSGFESEVLQ